MSLIKKIRDILIKSGFTVNSRKISLFFLKNKLLMKFFRFKVSPKLLINRGIGPQEFSKIISEISVGPAFKTTGFERHNSSDDVLYGYIEKHIGQKSFADIGVSDGVSALYLIKKIKDLTNISISMYDKYAYLDLYPAWHGFTCSNVDRKIVYIKFFFLLIFLYPLEIVSKKTKSIRISFNSPFLKKFGLTVQYFDIFKTKLVSKVAFIKCANILNPVYFSKDKIKLALNNLYNNLADNGYLFIIHNTKDNESLAIFKKIPGGLVLERNTGNNDLPAYIGINDVFYINSTNKDA